jgi:hypothetical protein
MRGLTKPSTLPLGFKVNTKAEFDGGVLTSVESFVDAEGNGKVRLTKTGSISLTAATSGDADSPMRGALTELFWLAQSFDVTDYAGQAISALVVRLKKTLTPTGNIHIGLYKDAGGKPGEMVGGGELDITTVTTSYASYTITITGWTVPTEVTTIWIGIKNTTSTALTPTKNLYWHIKSGNPYSGGQAGSAANIGGWPASWSSGWNVNGAYDFYCSLTVSAYAATGTYSSKVYDAGSTVTFSAFSANTYFAGGGAHYYARADTSTFAKDAVSPAWIDLGAGTDGYWSYVLASNANFQSKRYIQMRAILTPPTGQKVSPELDWLAVGYRSGTFADSLADSVVRDGRYLCACKTTAVAVNDTILVLDKNSAWTIFKDLALASLHEHNGILYAGKHFGTAPSAPVITNGGTPGSTTYGYKIVAHYGNGGTTALTAEGTTATGNATLSGTNYNIITWSAVTGATSYKVYRTTGGATQGLIATITGAVTTNDTGIVATGGAPALSSLINADDSTVLDADSGVPFDAFGITKAFDLGAPDIYKDFRKIFVQYRDRANSRLAKQRLQWSRDLGYLTGAEAWQNMSMGYGLTSVAAMGVTTREIPQTDRARGWLMSYRFGKVEAGEVFSVSVGDGKTGYAEGDVLTLTTGGTGATVKVITVDADGTILTVLLLTGGEDYATGTSATSGGTGSGATMSISEVAVPSGIEMQGIILYVFVGRGAKPGRGPSPSPGDIFPEY